MQGQGHHEEQLSLEISRRLTLKDQQHQSQAFNAPCAREHFDVALHPRLLCEEHHDAGVDDEGLGLLGDSRLHDGRAASSSPSQQQLQQQQQQQVVLRWRQKEKLKTTAVALVLCLNIGVDPPDVIKISPCARLECWVDPLSNQPAKALETIGKNLQAQYERWQPKAKYKTHLDPTVDDVKKLAQSCRRNAKTERVLFHYNGHGVPRPTANGEIWVFNSRYTQYIPLSIYELQAWLGAPCIYVLDCSSAGVIINAFKAFMDSKAHQGQAFAGMPGGLDPNDPMREIIVLAACGAHEVLPQNPELPADVFTACLTTPIKVALRWFCSRSLLRHDGITKDLIDQIPGRQTDRKTPLGELNWIFTAITDTIAWNVLPKPLFQKLFRSDLLVASLFRNFLLAERIMTAANCNPVSYPRLPPTHNHPMWQAWDMAAEMCLMQLPTLIANPTAEFKPSSFFSEQLTAFDLWLAHGAQDKKPPEQLPIVLQVLLSQVHRLRALVLLGRFLDMGPWAVDLALSVGIFPYVLKLLQTISVDLRPTLVFIWCKILALDLSCQADLVKDNGHSYFIKYLDSLVVVDGAADLNSRAQAAFVLSAVCDSHPKGQALCASGNLLATLLKWLRFMFPPQEPFQTPGQALLLKWLCLCLGKLCQDAPEVSLLAIREGAADLLVQLLTMASPVIRAAAVFGLGCLVHSLPSTPQIIEEVRGPDGSLLPPLVSPACNEDRLPAEQLIGNAVKQVVYDPSVLVRCELAVLYARFVRGHAPRMQEVLATQQHRLADFARQHAVQPPSSPLSTSAPPLHHGSAGAVHGSSHSTMEGTRRGSMESGYEGRRTQSTRGPPASSSSTSNLAQRTTTGPAGVGATSPPSFPPGDQLPSGESPSGGMAGGVTGAEEAAAAAGVAARPFPGPNEGLSAQQQQALATYSALLESIQMLALDPSPKVAKLGRQVLRIAGCELQFVEMPPPGMSASSGGPPGSSGATSGTNGPSSPHNTSNTLVALKQKVLHPRTWARPSGGAAAIPSASGAPPSADRSGSSAASGASAGEGLQPVATSGVAGGGVSMLSTPSSSCPPSPTRGSSNITFARHPYVLKPLGKGSGNRDPRGFFMQPPQPPPAQTVTLPQSPIYKMSSEAFSRPLLEPMATAWRDTEGCIATPWTGPVDPGRRAFRLREIETSMARCHHITSPKLREQVYSIEHGSADGLTAVTFHPYHPLLICADTRGYIKVSNFQDSTLANAFHVASGTSLNDPRQMSANVTFLQQLNEADGPMLLTGCSDGTVRVWRNYTLPGCQRMATALQSATIHLPPQTGKAATYAWAPARSQLYAAGGCHPDMVYCWDLQQEVCSSLIRTSTPGSIPVSVDRILLGAYSAGSSASCMHPALLVAACSDATLRLYDVRTNNAGPAMVLQPFRQPPAGVAVEPAGKPSIIAAASERGELRMMDLRMVPHLQANTGTPGLEAGSVHQGSNAYDAALDCALKSVPAHSKGGVSALVAHSHAPLMATGTKSQVVKVWTDECDVVGAIRPQSAFLSHKAGPVTCMAWHPYQPLLAAGSSDSTATVYAIDQSVGPGSFSLKQHNLNSSSVSNTGKEKGSLVRTSWS